MVCQRNNSEIEIGFPYDQGVVNTFKTMFSKFYPKWDSTYKKWRISILNEDVLTTLETFKDWYISRETSTQSSQPKSPISASSSQRNFIRTLAKQIQHIEQFDSIGGYEPDYSKGETAGSLAYKEYMELADRSGLTSKEASDAIEMLKFMKRDEM